MIPLQLFPPRPYPFSTSCIPQLLFRTPACCPNSWHVKHNLRQNVTAPSWQILSITCLQCKTTWNRKCRCRTSREVLWLRMLPPPQLGSHCFFSWGYIFRSQPAADIDQLCSSHRSLSLAKNSSGGRGGGFQLFSSPLLSLLPCNEGEAIFSCSWLDVIVTVFLLYRAVYPHMCL